MAVFPPGKDRAAEGETGDIADPAAELTVEEARAGS
jgi:hypothetical protein